MNRNKLNEFGERNEMGGSDAQQTYMVRHYRHHRFVRIARIAILILFLAVWDRQFLLLQPRPRSYLFHLHGA